MKVALETIGCRTNRADSARLGNWFAAQGHVLVDNQDEAELVLVNSCTVTARADRDCRAACYRARRAPGNPWVLLYGCLVRAGRMDLGWMDGRTLPVKDLGDLDALVASLGRQEPPQPPTIAQPMPGPRRGESRYFLKIQEGCSQRCSYCVVPDARGIPRSVPLDEILEEAHRACRAGYADLVLTGTHAAHWGRDLVPGSTFSTLLECLMVAGLPARFRLGSLEPLEDDQDQVLAAMVPGGPLCAHLHLPLQSGSQTILEAMGRPWGLERFTAISQRARRLCGPRLSVGTDLIVGFPGETEALFEETLAFLESADLAQIHAFSFSARPGTPAALLQGSISSQELRHRTNLVRSLGARKLKAFQEAMVGQILAVSVVDEGGGDQGLSENFLRCRLEGGGDLRRGSWLMTEAVAVRGGELYCKVLGPAPLPGRPALGPGGECGLEQ